MYICARCSKHLSSSTAGSLLVQIRFLRKCLVHAPSFKGASKTTLTLNPNPKPHVCKDASLSAVKLDIQTSKSPDASSNPRSGKHVDIPFYDPKNRSESHVVLSGYLPVLHHCCGHPACYSCWPLTSTHGRSIAVKRSRVSARVPHHFQSRRHPQTSLDPAKLAPSLRTQAKPSPEGV